MKHGKLSNHGNQGSHGNQCNHGNITNQGYYVNVINQNNHTFRYENYPLFVSDLNHNSKVPKNFVKILNKNFHAVHSVVELVHAGRSTDGRTE